MKNRFYIKSIGALILLISGLFAPSAHASHYLGSEISYSCIGGNQYEFRLTAYTDCSAITNPLTLNINLNDGCGNTSSLALNLLAGYPMDITPLCSTSPSSCNGGSGSIGFAKYVYTGTTTLSPSCGNVTASWSSCCRNNAAANLLNPSSNAHYIAAVLDTLPSACNSSPTFAEEQPIRIGCTNDTTSLNFSATDVDGDVLVYSLVSAKSASNVNIAYNTGLSAQNPFLGSVSIDNTTGIVTITASTVQTGTINVKVEEFRNGAKIGETTREAMIYIMNCSGNTTPKITEVNGISVVGSNWAYSVTAGTPLSLNSTIYDAEVAAGTQSDSIFWQNVPTGATAAGYAFNWTPTNADVGTHYVTITVLDDACPIMGINSYAFKITVSPSLYANTNTSATMAAGAISYICLDTAALTIASSTLQTDSFNHAQILAIDLTSGCLKIKADSIAVDSVVILLCDNAGYCITNTVFLTVEQGVWPGDADVDLQVNNFDLLNIGLGYGSSGTPRAVISTAWNGFVAADWAQSTPAGLVNYKHLDCNGDGIINGLDTTAILNNWGASYTYNQKGAGGGTIPFYVDAAITPTAYNLQLPIILGSATIPANNIYGLAFTIYYDTTLVKERTTDIDISNSWLGTANTNLIEIHKEFYTAGEIQVAITRIDGQNVSGFGQIGTFDFTIQDDIMLQRQDTLYPFHIGNIKVIDNQAQPILVSPITSVMTITTGTNAINLEPLVTVFPNPVANTLTVRTSDLVIKNVTLRSLSGQVVQSEIVNNTQTQLYMQNLPNGIYTLSVQTDKGQVFKKITVLR